MSRTQNKNTWKSAVKQTIESKLNSFISHWFVVIIVLIHDLMLSFQLSSPILIGIIETIKGARESEEKKLSIPVDGRILKLTRSWMNDKRNKTNKQTLFLPLHTHTEKANFVGFIWKRRKQCKFQCVLAVSVAHKVDFLYTHSYSHTHKHKREQKKTKNFVNSSCFEIDDLKIWICEGDAKKRAKRKREERPKEREQIKRNNNCRCAFD